MHGPVCYCDSWVKIAPLLSVWSTMRNLIWKTEINEPTLFNNGYSSCELRTVKESQWFPLCARLIFWRGAMTRLSARKWSVCSNLSGTKSFVRRRGKKKALPFQRKVSGDPNEAQLQSSCDVSSGSCAARRNPISPGSVGRSLLFTHAPRMGSQELHSVEIVALLTRRQQRNAAATTTTKELFPKPNGSN